MNSSPRSCARLTLGLLLFSTLLAAQIPGGSPIVPQNATCKIYQTAPAQFPVRLMNKGVTRGEARIVAEIDSQGQLRETLIAAYTHREFADAALAALKRWRFEPGYIEGQPIVSVLTVSFEFETTGVLVHEVTVDSKNQKERLDQSLAYYPHGLDTLDRRPARVSGDRPDYPKAWIEQGRTGAVTVEFFIDENGQTRLPAVIAHDDGFLAAAALAAVKTWRFEPPTHRGKPVLVRAEQQFVFRPEANRS
jgi:TonB family protein